MRSALTRIGPWAAGLAAAALALAGCSGAGSGTQAASTPADTGAKVTLTWWDGQNAEAHKTLETMAQDFSTLHPNVTIDVSSGAPTTEELLQKLTAGFASGTYPDVSYAFGSWAGQLGESGKALDLSAAVQDPAVGWNDFPEAARRTASPGGKVIGFPALVDNLALLYNPTLFAAAGVSEPTGDWTWDDFRAAAKKITDRSRNIYGTAFSVSGSEDTTWHLWPQLWQGGGDILSADQTKAAFNSDAGVKALEFWRQLAVEDKSVYLDQTDEKYGPLFVDGRVGMIISGPWQLYDLVQKKTPYKVAFLPGTNGNHETISGPDIWATFDHGDANRAYWTTQLMAYVTSPAQDNKFNLANGNLPLRTEAKDTPEFVQYVKDYPGADVLFANLANATRPRPTIPAYVEVSGYFGKAVAQVLQGAADPKKALDEAAKRSDQALAGG